MKVLLCLFLLVTSQFSFAQSDGSKSSANCEDIKVEPCIEFRGRARSYMGRAETRIWKIGSNRLFAVAKKSSEAKSELSKVNFHQDLFANFNVCPTSKYEKGAMQDVCVASVSHASIKSTGQ